INVKADWSKRGAAFYDDEYVKLDGQWKIKHTGFKRIFTEVWTRSETKSLRLLDNMHASSQK
ncbi:MAG: nuclear transport factor 2 family protein, partial [Chloroflexi bacterium]|nr:nuclear transport factor 2 family protein [Chloroflexota bacterium]